MTVHRLCQARVLRPADGHASRPCRNPARWWVATPHRHDGEALPVCGVHARGWTNRWPLVTDDPWPDRRLLLETFT